MNLLRCHKPSLRQSHAHLHVILKHPCCKFLHNCVICWNTLHLSEPLYKPTTHFTFVRTSYLYYTNLTFVKIYSECEGIIPEKTYWCIVERNRYIEKDILRKRDCGLGSGLRDSSPQDSKKVSGFKHSTFYCHMYKVPCTEYNEILMWKPSI